MKNKIPAIHVYELVAIFEGNERLILRTCDIKEAKKVYSKHDDGMFAGVRIKVDGKILAIHEADKLMYAGTDGAKAPFVIPKETPKNHSRDIHHL